MKTYLRFRYILDFLAALLLLIALSPVMLVVAIYVGLDGGSVFFRQTRIGYLGKEFQVLKFRSMVMNADDFLNENGEVTKDRITRVGKFIRKTSLDELPQLINILLGEMAIIGPRPILPFMVPYMTNVEKGRFDARPGVTGLAQTNGRNNVKWSKRFEMDLEYLNRVNLWLDVKIAWSTICLVIKAADIAEDRNAGQVDDITNRKTPIHH
jgi:lipopolysaccharide/colanic/teichoic acid biosynthesis glycosyltransferase